MQGKRSTAAKTNKTAALSKVASDANVLEVTLEKGKRRELQLTEIGLSPCGANANTARLYAKPFAGELNITDAIAVMANKASKVQRGDLSEVEATLTAQAVALDAIFNGLANRAASNMGQYIGACETYLRLALKAQAQCRATLETLAEVKYPRAPTFVRQQNVAYQQQVNNGGANDAVTSTHAHERKNHSPQNELLEGPADERTHLDTRATPTTSASNQTMEAVGAIDRR